MKKENFFPAYKSCTSFNVRNKMPDTWTQDDLSVGESRVSQIARSQNEILRPRTSSISSRTFHSHHKTASDSGVDELVNDFDNIEGVHNAAFDTSGEDDIKNNDQTLPTDSIGLSHSDSLNDNAKENASDTKKFTCSVNRYKGVALALLSTVTLSFSTLTVGLLRGSVQSNEVVFAQMLIELLFSLPLATLERASVLLPRKALVLVLFRSFIGSVGTILAFFAFQVMPIGNAKAIIYSSPVFTGLFSCILLHEACTVVDILLSAVTLSGVFLVIQPPFIFGGQQTSTTILGPIFCLIVAVLAGTVFITLRKIGMYKIHPTVILIYFSIIGMVLSAIMSTALREWVIPRCGRDRILLILTGTFQFASQVGVTLSLRYEKATTVALIRTTDVLFTFILDYLFFDIIPNAITITGAILIIGSLVGITLRKWWSEKKALRDKGSEEQSTPDEDLVQGFSGDETSLTD